MSQQETITESRIEEARRLRELCTARQPAGVDGSKSSNAIRFRLGQRRCQSCKIYLTKEGWYVGTAGKRGKRAEVRERCKLCHNITLGPVWSLTDFEKVKKTKRPLLGSHCVVIYSKSVEPARIQPLVQIQVQNRVANSR